MRDGHFDGTSYAIYIPILSITSSSILTAVVYVLVFFCDTVVSRSSGLISKELEAMESLLCKWSVEKAQQKSLHTGVLAEIQNLRVLFLTQASHSGLVVCSRKPWMTPHGVR